MSSEPSEARPRLRETIPYMWVADVPKAVPYYRDVLGFEVEFTEDWEYGGEKFGLAIIARDGVVLHLRTCECGDWRHTGLGFFRLEVVGLDALHEEFVKAGAIVRFEPTTQDWGHRDFQIDDPEGNRIYIYEQL